MKKSLLVVSLFLFFGLISNSYAQKVASGQFKATASTPGFTLNQNSGERNVQIEVKFDQPFTNKPSVVVSVSLVDADKSTNLRYNVQPAYISRDGFVIKIATWGDTKINAIGGGWIAVSE